MKVQEHISPRDATVLGKISNRSVRVFGFAIPSCIDALQATVCVCVCLCLSVQAGEKPSPRVNVQSLLCLHPLTSSHTVVTGAGFKVQLPQKQKKENKEAWPALAEELRDKSLKKQRLHSYLWCGLICEYYNEGVKTVDRNFTVCKCRHPNSPAY